MGSDLLIFIIDILWVILVLFGILKFRELQIRKTLDRLGVSIKFPKKPKLKVFGNMKDGSYAFNCNLDEYTNYNITIFSQESISDDDYLNEYHEFLVSEANTPKVGEVIAEREVTIDKNRGKEVEMAFPIDELHDSYCKLWTFKKGKKVILVSYTKTIEAGSAFEPDKEFFKSFRFIDNI